MCEEKGTEISSFLGGTSPADFSTAGNGSPAFDGHGRYLFQTHGMRVKYFRFYFLMWMLNVGKNIGLDNLQVPSKCLP